MSETQSENVFLKMFDLYPVCEIIERCLDPISYVCLSRTCSKLSNVFKNAYVLLDVPLNIMNYRRTLLDIVRGDKDGELCLSYSNQSLYSDFRYTSPRVEYRLSDQLRDFITCEKAPKPSSYVLQWYHFQDVGPPIVKKRKRLTKTIPRASIYPPYEGTKLTLKRSYDS